MRFTRGTGVKAYLQAAEALGKVPGDQSCGLAASFLRGRYVETDLSLDKLVIFCPESCRYIVISKNSVFFSFQTVDFFEWSGKNHYVCLL